LAAGKERGARKGKSNYNGPDAIREQWYRLFYWHTDVKLADVGNIKYGATLADTYAALKNRGYRTHRHRQNVIILADHTDLTLPQYYTYANRKKIIEVTCVDALIDLNIDSLYRSDNFLMESYRLNHYIRHYNISGFQSYYVHPNMLETWISCALIVSG